MKTSVSLLSLALLALAPANAAPSSCCQSASAPAPDASAAPLPDTSLYHTTATWQDQDGRTLALRDLGGSPVVITMIFTHCAFACPRTIADLRAIENTLPADARSRVRFVLASFDTARDTPERLRAWATGHGLGPQWTLLHGDAEAVRELSVLLDIAYLPQPDGSFAHGNRLVLLDAQGAPVAASEGLGARPGPIVNAATQLIRE